MALCLYLVLINALAFGLMLADKRRARKKIWRIPESTLMVTALLGGSLGALVGMYTAHHKTRHRFQQNDAGFFSIPGSPGRSP